MKYDLHHLVASMTKFPSEIWKGFTRLRMTNSTSSNSILHNTQSQQIKLFTDLLNARRISQGMHFSDKWYRYMVKLCDIDVYNIVRKRIRGHVILESWKDYHLTWLAQTSNDIHILLITNENIRSEKSANWEILKNAVNVSKMWLLKFYHAYL